MIAAVLDLDEGACATVEALDKMCGSLSSRHDIVHLNGSVVERIKDFALELLRVAEDNIYFGHVRVARGIDLGRAARDNDPGGRVLAPRATDRLAGLPLGLGRDGTGIDDDGVGQTGGIGMLAHHFGLVGVKSTSESENFGRTVLSH